MQSDTKDERARMTSTMSIVARILQAYATASFALATGFFATFYFVITPSFLRLDAQTMLSAMTAVNAGVRSPLFAATFFGAPLSCLGVCVLLVSLHRLKEATIWFTALSVYFFLVFLPTVLINLPINENLAKMGSFATEFSVRTQLESWHLSNGLRTVGSSAALFLSLVMAFLRSTNRSPASSLSHTGSLFSRRHSSKRSRST